MEEIIDREERALKRSKPNVAVKKRRALVYDVTNAANEQLLFASRAEAESAKAGSIDYIVYDYEDWRFIDMYQCHEGSDKDYYQKVREIISPVFLAPYTGPKSNYYSPIRTLETREAR